VSESRVETLKMGARLMPGMSLTGRWKMYVKLVLVCECCGDACCAGSCPEAVGDGVYACLACGEVSRVVREIPVRELTPEILVA